MGCKLLSPQYSQQLLLKGNYCLFPANGREISPLFDHRQVLIYPYSNSHTITAIKIPGFCDTATLRVPMILRKTSDSNWVHHQLKSWQRVWAVLSRMTQFQSLRVWTLHKLDPQRKWVPDREREWFFSLWKQKSELQFLNLFDNLAYIWQILQIFELAAMFKL